MCWKFLFIVLSFAQLGAFQERQTFEIDYEYNAFMLDGKFFQFMSGTMNYFGSFPGSWRHKLRMMKLAGLNAVDVSIQWSLHNPKDGVYNFEGNADLEKFLQMVTEEGFYIILRPGPYISSGVDNGGIPYWLATKYPDIKLRSTDPNFLKELDKWFSKVLSIVRPYLLANGGKILIVEVEHEYGAMKICDDAYKSHVKNIIEEVLETKPFLFTTDRPRDKEIKCGAIEDVFATTNFGISDTAEMLYYFVSYLQEVQTEGPLMNSQLFTGDPNYWQKPSKYSLVDGVSSTALNLLTNFNNLNIDSFQTGVNFGFSSGVVEDEENFKPLTPAYNINSALDEIGNPRRSYETIADAIFFYTFEPRGEFPPLIPTIKYKSFQVRGTSSILSETGKRFLSSKVVTQEKLLTFEELNQFSGFVLYETDLPTFTRDPSNLVVHGVRDRAQIYIDQRLIGVLSRQNQINSLPVLANRGKKLQILVENQGRVGSGNNFDFKGILGNVSLQSFNEPYEELSPWTITGFPFEDLSKIEDFFAADRFQYEIKKNGLLLEGPVIFYGELDISQETEIIDTWWNAEGWGKGVLFVNGFNLSRYWPLVGPQMTVHIPKDLLHHGVNKFIILELQKAPQDLLVHFSDSAIFI